LRFIAWHSRPIIPTYDRGRTIRHRSEEIEVGGKRPVASLAGIAGIEAQTIRDLNPELLQGYTPRGENRFRVKLPIGNGAIAELLGPRRDNLNGRCRERISGSQGSTRPLLLSIARRYRQEVRMLMEEPAKLPLRVGQKLKVLLQSLRGTLR
jgi:hypothetical protein